MNRKLRHTILAFSTSGVMLLLGLVAGQPLPSGPDATFAAARAAPAAHADEPALRPDAATAEPQRRRRGSTAREVFAIPYFSFARGSRGSRS